MTGLLITEPLSRTALRCLTDVAMNVVQHSPFDWQFELPAGDRPGGRSIADTETAEECLWPGTACVEGDWLRIEVTCSAPGPQACTTLTDELRLNPQFGPGVRLARNGQRQLVLLGELTALPHSAQHNMDDCVQSLLRNLLSAISQLSRTPTAIEATAAAAAAADRDDSEPPSGAAHELPSPLELAHAAGWEANPREADRAAVTLDVPGAFHQAELRRLPAGDLLLDVPVVAISGEKSLAIQAVAVLLQTTACSLRLPRAIARDSVSAGEAALQFGWQVLLPGETDSELLHQTLAALSVAMRLTAAEASALQSEELSRRYLAVRGWSP